MFTWIKKLALLVFVLLALLCAGVLATAYIFEDELVAEVKKGLNERLTHPVNVGKVSLSVWKQFPKASIVIDKPSLIVANDTVLQAEHLYLAFSLIDLLQREIVIDKIALEDGQLFLEQRPNGSWNFEIWESSGTSNQSTFKIGRVSLENIQLRVKHPDVNTHGFWKRLEISGDFAQKNLRLAGQAQALSLNTQNDSWLEQSRLSVQGNLVAQEDHWYWNAVQLQFPELEVNSSGAYTQQGWDIQLNSSYFKLDALEFSPFINALLPEELAKTGKAKLNGSVSVREQVAVNLDFLVENTQWNLSDFHPIVLDQFEGRLKYNNGQFSLASIRGKGSYLDVSITSKNGSLAVGDVLQLHFPSCQLAVKNGVLWDTPSSQYVGSVDYQGDLKISVPLQSQKLQLWPGSGRLVVGSLENKKQPGWKFEDAQITRQKKDWICEKSTLTIGTNTLQYSGTVSLDPNLMESEIRLRGYLEANQLDLNAFANSQESEGNWSPVPIVANLDFYFKSISSNKITLEENLGKLEWNGGSNLTLTNCKTGLANGIFEGDVSLDFLPNQHVLLTGDLSLDGVSVQQLFYEFEDFGQTAVSHRNLEGNLDAQVSFRTRLDANLSLVPKSLNAQGNVLIAKGALKQLPLFEELSGALRKNLLTNVFINVDRMANALEAIHLENLSNRFEITNGVVRFPKMEVNSDVFDLNLAGEHSMDNRIDYRMDFLLADALRIGKTKKERDSGKRLFIRVSGTADNPEFSLDSEAAKAFREQMQKEETPVSRKSFFEKEPETKNVEKPKPAPQRDSTEAATVASDSKKKKKRHWLAPNQEEEKVKVEIDFSEEDL